MTLNTAINHLQQVADASQHLRIHRQPAVHGITCRKGWDARNQADVGRHGEAAQQCWGPLSWERLGTTKDFEFVLECCSGAYLAWLPSAWRTHAGT